MKSIAILPILLFATTAICSQGISINANNVPPDPSAILDINSTSKGVLFPRLSQAQRNLIQSPVAGLVIYQSDVDPGLYMFDGALWQLITTTANAWSTHGNAGTNPANQFMGTTDNVPLRFRVNNKRVGEFNESIKAIMLGDSAGITMVSAFENIAIGDKALRDNVAGWFNVAIGPRALMKTTAYSNVAFGVSALANNTTGIYNGAFGNNALFLNSTGFYNLAIGEAAMNQNVSGFQNVAVGHYALYANAGQANTAVGNESLYAHSAGNNNTSIGFQSMYSGTGGDYNTAVGSAALRSGNSTGNTAVGYRAGYSTSTGMQNVFMGTLAMEDNVAGSYNTAIGENAMRNTNASFNTGIGSQVLFNNTSGQNNAAIGSHAMSGNISGESNTAVGALALANNMEGDFHIAVGYNSGTAVSAPNLNNTIGIGNHGILHTISNQVIIGNSAMEHIGGFEPWEVYSDARIKEDVREDVIGLEFITRLRPVTYLRKVDAPSLVTGDVLLPEFAGKYNVEIERQTGFLAQEVEAAAKDCGYDFSGVTRPAHDRMLYSLSYESFVVPLVKGMQEQQVLIEAQRQQIHAQDGIIRQQQAIIEALMEGYIDHEERLTAVERQKTK